MFQINEYFFNVTDFEIDPIEIGKTRRSRGGKVHTDYSNTYYTFNLIIENADTQTHGKLLYLLNLNRPDASAGAEDLTFIDDKGNNYTVTIPINGAKFTRVEGTEERYDWELKLEEVV